MANERPFQILLPVPTAAYGCLSVLGACVAPWRGAASHAATALVFVSFIGSALLWRWRGPHADGRLLTPIGRFVYPIMLVVGFVVVVVVIVVPL